MAEDRRCPKDWWDFINEKLESKIPVEEVLDKAIEEGWGVQIGEEMCITEGRKKFLKELPDVAFAPLEIDTLKSKKLDPHEFSAYVNKLRNAVYSLDMSKTYQSYEEYCSMYSVEDTEEQDVAIKVFYRMAKDLVSKNSEEARLSFSQVLEMARNNPLWLCKALKQSVKLSYGLGRLVEMWKFYKELLTYIGSAVPSHYSVKCIGNLLDFFSRLPDKKLKGELFQLTVNAFRQIKIHDPNNLVEACDPAISAVISECNGKLQLLDGQWPEAAKSFFGAFQAFYKVENLRCLQCLKWFGILHKMLETEKNLSEIHAAYQCKNDPDVLLDLSNLDDVDQTIETSELKRILQTNQTEHHSSVQSLNEFFKRMRTQMLLKLMKSDRSLPFSLLSEKLDLPKGNVKGFLLLLISEESIQGVIDNSKSIFKHRDSFDLIKYGDSFDLI